MSSPRWAHVGRGTASAGVLLLADPSYVLPAHLERSGTSSKGAGLTLPCPRDPVETWPSVRSKLNRRSIHSMWVDSVSAPVATLVEGLGARAPYDVFEREAVEPEGDEWLVDEVRLVFPQHDEVSSPAAIHAAGWQLVRTSGPIDSGMFAIIDPARALADPATGLLGIHYEHDVTAQWVVPDCGTGTTNPPEACGRGMSVFRDGAMWIEGALGGDAPYDLAARFVDGRLAEVSFRIDGVRLGSEAP